MLSNTIRRVPDHTDADVNRRILEGTARRVLHYASHREGIDQRLRELDREWDIERVLEANAAAVGFAGIAMAAIGFRRFLRLSALVSVFLFQHAVQGWCPPIPLLRRLGIRTAREIEVERIALKALRGDFDDVADDANRALQAAIL
jgi:hypothetical protein